MDRLWQDLAFGIRAIGRRPGFTLLAASMLALGAVSRQERAGSR